jgi:hypothetical protein
MDCTCGALIYTDTTTFAVKEISFKTPFLILTYTRLGTEEITDPTLYAALLIPDRMLRLPVPGLILTGVTGFFDNAADL